MMAHLLLDTHVALWWSTGHSRLDAQAQAIIDDSRCHLSAASVWEIVDKFKFGKLPVSPVNWSRQHGSRA